MTWRHAVKQLIDLAKQDEVQEALAILHSLFYGTPHDITVYLLEVAFHRAEKGRLAGLHSTEEYHILLNKIIKGLFELSKQMNDELAKKIQEEISLGLRQYDQLMAMDTAQLSPKFKQPFRVLDQYKESFFMTDRSYLVLSHLFERGMGTPKDTENAALFFDKVVI